MHAHADLATAHEYALTKVNLRQVESSKMVVRLTVDSHNCWSDCAADGELMRAKVQAWADAVSGFLPTVQIPGVEGEVSEAQVLEWIAADRAGVPADAIDYVRYISLHELHNLGATPDDMNTARAGISKILNSTARHAPAIVNPVAVDPYYLVYRFDVRDYWGYAAAGIFGIFGGGGEPQLDPARALATWDRLVQGNVNADGPDAQTGTFPNIAGFHPDYVDATQLAYTLSRPDVYNEIMGLPPVASLLEAELGVDLQGPDVKYMTVDDAITINQRMMLRAPIQDGYYWKSIDQFSQTDFVFYERPVPEYNDDSSQVKTTPLTVTATGAYETSGSMTLDESGNLVGGLQASAAEIIFSLPNGLQAYMIAGAGNQLRYDAFPFIVVDPRRGGAVGDEGRSFGYFRLGEGASWRLLNGASCMGCHAEGMNRAPDGMQRFLEANPAAYDQATLDRVRQLYPGDEVMRPQIEADRDTFGEAMRSIREAMIVGTPDKTLYVEPIMYLFESAQGIYGYQNTQSN